MAVIVVSLAGCAVQSDQPLSEVVQGTTVCGASSDAVHGIDVSSYETSIDWAMAKASGVDFAFIRVSDGLQHRDAKFATYWPGAKAAGVMRGAYQFFRPAQDPIAQAQLLLDAMGPRMPGDLPPVIDVETTSGLAPAQVEASVRAWVDHVTGAIGRRPIIYAGYYSWQDYTGNANLTSSPLWHAQYTSAACPNIPTPWTRWLFWQHSSTGTVPGVLGEPTDMNVFDGTLDELRAFADEAPAPCGVIDPAGGEIDDTHPCFSAGGPESTLRRVDDLIWTRATSSSYIGNFAVWQLVFAEAGHYRVEVHTSASYADSHRAKYKVRAAGELHTVVVDQAVDGWQSLGELAFDAGDDQFVELDDNTGDTNGERLVFDRVRVTRADRLLPTPPDAISLDDEGGGCNAGGNAGLLLAFGACASLLRSRSCAASTKAKRASSTSTG
jgi:lysozyme